MTDHPARRQPSDISASSGHHDGAAPRQAETTRQIETVVFALVPEFTQVKVRDGEGHVYALTRKTEGIDLLALREGQHVRCTVTRELPRVVSAQAFA